MTKSPSVFTPVLIGGCLIILISFGIRAAFGVFQIPIANEFGWLRSDFSMAIAIQNLAWGIGQPLFGAFAGRFGDRKAIFLGAVLYAAGLVFSAYAITPGQHQFLEILVGFGIAGTGMGLIIAIVGRTSAPEHRSLAMGIATAAGSAGQVIGPPMAEFLLSMMTWQSVFIVFAAAISAAMLLLPFLKSEPVATTQELEETLGQILGRAFRDPTFTLIAVGFFSCGYQLSFITAHFPAFITEVCAEIIPGSMLDSLGVSTTSALGAVALALIGLANIGGTVLAGWLGSIYSKKYLLAGVYFGRTIAAAVFISLPMTPLTVIVFSVVMGSLWLATVPLTAGLVGYIYGLRHMATLYGLVFFSHQLGSFMGVWLGGHMYDRFGSYNAVWWVGVGVGLLSAIVHFPVDERPLNDRKPA